MSRGLGASLSLVILVATADAQTLKLAADNNSGHDKVWVKRDSAGVHSWGIVGNHVPGTNGTIWFQSFPGASGSYKMELGAVLEPDGNSRYRGGKVDQQLKISGGPAPKADSGALAGDTGAPVEDAGAQDDSGAPAPADGRAPSPDAGGGGSTSDGGGAAGPDGAGPAGAARAEEGCTMVSPGAANPRVGALLVGFSFIVLGLLLLLLVLRRGDVE